MTWDSVPWFVGGGALHSPEVARLLAYAATSGAQGIVSAGELKVRPLDVPGSQVRVMTGAAVIPNLSQGGTDQSYVAYLPTEDVVSIAATGSSGARNDMVIARIEDPFEAGTPWSEPADPKTGPYVYTRVLSNVPASAIASPKAARDYLRAQNFSAIPLAGIAMPPSTGTVTDGLIINLRELAQPRHLPLMAGGVPNSYSHAAGYSEPGDPYGMARVSEVRPQIAIPDWATYVDLSAEALNLSAPSSASGAALVRLGSAYGPHINFNFTTQRQSLFAASVGANIADLAGTTQELTLRIRLDSGPLVIPDWGYIKFDIVFHEWAV